ncbi:DUF4837 family protein [Flavobacterium rhizosphaerae]|uniref:DUF4837 family protein n=1 Tax=Flavobacterium rhizosphaerae TaxID=3163298 RepID=A0ABW8Z2N3_9FLAO
MRNIAAILTILLLLFTACQGTKDDVAESTGNINEISIIVSDALWNGKVGDSLRKKFAAPVDGLSQEEPIFTLNQYNDQTFAGNLKKRRNIIVVEKTGNPEFLFQQNSYCSPQNIFFLKGKTADSLLVLIQMHSDEIIKRIKKTEISEYQSRNRINGLLDKKHYEKQYGITIDVPKTYTRAIQKNSFTWLKRDMPGGNTNIMLYTVSYNQVERDKDILNNIIAMRDSIGALYIHGQDENTFMVTEDSYAPYLFMTSFKDKRAFETRGNWDMENGTMGGPFINYAVKDDKNHRYVVIEGFIYSPSSPRRDLIMEIEAIIKSVIFI